MCVCVCVCVCECVCGRVGGSVKGRGRETRSWKRPEVPLNELPFNIITRMGKCSVSRNALCSEYWIRQGSSSIILVWRIGTELSWWDFFLHIDGYACTRFSWNELRNLTVAIHVDAPTKSIHIVQVLASVVLVTLCMCGLPIVDDKPITDKGNISPPDFVFPVLITVVSNVGFGEGRQKSGRGAMCWIQEPNVGSWFQIDGVEEVKIREDGNRVLTMKQENSTDMRAMRVRPQSPQTIQRSGVGGINKEAKPGSQDWTGPCFWRVPWTAFWGLLANKRVTGNLVFDNPT